ncbi:hypothetical protein Tsubulata_011289 [Turnera subulata]|uniref:FMP27/BLTP2/Hobbit GFWDK motif-containing RBG unit domain-containing protein n=1 Tax=Turnera subulata TaxID=218843 RepID=A0A9Q0FF23_9ROSI|nr:hypothetical protein Tsubulata_011289 [Turnera subulata]
MAASPVKFLFGFLIVSITLWLLFIFASRLVALLLSRIVGASIGFRVGGWKCLRDIVIKLKKGSVESVSVGEIRLSVRQSLVKLGAGFLSRDPKLQVLICDLEVVLRPSNKSAKKVKTQKARPQNPGRGKFMVLANIARFLSVSVTDLVVKVLILVSQTPKASVEVKELRVDISKEGGSTSTLFVKLQILPILIHMGEPRATCDQSCNSNSGGCIDSAEASLGQVENSSAPFSCEEFSLSCEFGHNREVGVIVQNLDISCGEIAVNLNEELLSKKKSSSDVSSNTDGGSMVSSSVSQSPQKKQSGLAGITKFASVLPEKFGFILPKLDVRFVHREHNLVVENNIMGIQLKSVKSRSTEDLGESTRLDVQLEFSEIHLVREAGTSVMEILKVDVVSFVYIPIQSKVMFFPRSVQPTSPIRAEIDVKLGGTQCNMIISRLKPWLQLHNSKKKKMVLQHEPPPPVKSQSTESKSIIMWTCTVSAPELTIVVYSISGSPLYHGCSQSSHLFANNISSKKMAVHMELGEFNFHMADEYQEYLKESLFGVESNSGALVHIAKVSLDWGEKEIESSEGDGARCKLVLSADVTGMGVFLNFKRVESLVVTAISFQALLKPLSTSGKKVTPSRGVRSSKPSGKGTQFVKFNLERCSVNLSGDTGLENTVVTDPKRVNYGSQGGRVIVSVSADGTPRTASVMSTVSDEFKKLKYSISLDIFHFVLSMNKEKQSMEVELERARSMYQEFLEEQGPEASVTLFDLQNAKFVRRSGGLKGIAICSLFSATNITARWEPDVHLSLIELGLRLKSLVHNQKLQVYGKDCTEDDPRTRDAEEKKETTSESGHDKHKKKETIFAVDVEILTISAAVGDGVEATLQVQSIFSENARIGVLLEGLLLSFNGARLLKSSRMQISRIPSASSMPSDAKVPATVTWDWVIQGLDVNICLPFRLELRAIDDAVEDMLRGLKLITAAKTELIFPTKKESSKPKRPSSTKFGRIKFCIRKLSADIEEEPLQGWLDEHYQLLKNEACELAVRLKFLDEFISKANQSPKAAETNDSSQEKKFIYNLNGVEVNIQDPSAAQTIQEEIYKQSFRSYYQACQKLVPAEGSGAASADPFQSGFKPSARRSSLLSVSATELEVSLTKIDGGDAGMIEVVRKLDPVSLEYNIPFSRLYGSNIFLRTGTLVVQLRDYTYPLLAATSGKLEGCVVLAQQATCFQPQMSQDVFIGKWRKVCMLRSATGTTPPMKSYLDLPLHFQKGEVSFGVGHEPPFADVSYAFTVALRRANLSVRDPGPLVQPPKKEKSLPWWDDMRNYIHGNNALFFSETRWHILATSDPSEKLDQLQVVTGSMEIQQSDGRVYLSTKDFRIFLSSLESLADSCGLKPPNGESIPFLETPTFTLEVLMDWGCDSGTPLNHYLFALPIEGKPRDFVFDPFRSTSLSLRWDFSLRPSIPSSENQSSSSSVSDVTVCNPHCQPETAAPTTINVGAHDFAWLVKFWTIMYLPPHKLRTFSRWPRFGVPRIPRSGNLSMDKVMTEFYFRLESTPTRIKYMPLDDDDPAKGLTFNMAKLKYELCFSRAQEIYTFECKRENLDLVYQGLDLHIPKAVLDKEDSITVATIVQKTRKNSQPSTVDRIPSEKHNKSSSTEKHRDDGFFLSCDYFTVRKQSPKADSVSLSAWQEAGRKNVEMTYVRSEFEHAGESDDQTRSDQSDDDGYNVVIADNCLRVFVYGLKLLWNIENRDAVWSSVGGLSKAFAPPKPSPSRQYAQRKLLGENTSSTEAVVPQNESTEAPSAPNTGSPPPEHLETSGSSSPPSQSMKIDDSLSTAIVTNGTIADTDEEGTRHFMVNVIEPQFNLHSEEANGRFLLAAVSGRVLAQSFHSILQVGHEVITQALGNEDVQLPEHVPEMTWKRMEFSVMLEHVQAHVAPTDVDPGAGLQWLPKILRSSPKVKRTGALLERVFMPCDMYLRYTRHKGGTPELKVKPLKELTFNSHNIMATMTSRQFQVMMDVLTNLLFARPPKPRKSSLSYPAEDDEDVEEEADEVVPDGVEEVELAKVNLEQKERERKLILHDIKKLSLHSDNCGDGHPKVEVDLWMVSGGGSTLVQGLKKELVSAKNCRKAASASLRTALQKAAQMRLMEKEKNKSPSYAMRISVQINKVVWTMILDGKPFAEAEINHLIFDFDRDYKDIGVALLTSKYFVVRNCLSNAKSDMVLSPWNPPPDWGKKVMLRVDAKQGIPKDGNSRIELFQVEIYPLKIYLTETMYRMMWGYFFPEEEQDSQRRQEVWKVSTTAGARRVKKGILSNEAPASCSHTAKESSKLIGSAGTELRRTSSFDRSWEETVAESVAAELVLQAHSSSLSSSKNEEDKLKETKPGKSGRPSVEDKKVGKAIEEKRSRPKKVIEFHNIKISQVELQLTYESSRFNLHELKLLMDTFHRVEFVGTWRRLFSRVKKHVVWGTLKSVTGMQGKKFKENKQGQQEPIVSGIPDSDLNFGDIDGGQLGTSDQYPNWLKRPTDGAGDGFVTSIKGLFSNQRRKATAFVLRTMRGEENDFQGEWSESDAEFSPFARQLTITKAKKLIRRHTKKFRSRQKGSSSQLPCSPRELMPFDDSDSSGDSSPYEDLHEYIEPRNAPEDL